MILKHKNVEPKRNFHHLCIKIHTRHNPSSSLPPSKLSSCLSMALEGFYSIPLHQRRHTVSWVHARLSQQMHPLDPHISHTKQVLYGAQQQLFQEKNYNRIKSQIPQVESKLVTRGEQVTYLCRTGSRNHSNRLWVTRSTSHQWPDEVNKILFITFPSVLPKYEILKLN